MKTTNAGYYCHLLFLSCVLFINSTHSFTPALVTVAPQQKQGVATAAITTNPGRRPLVVRALSTTTIEESTTSSSSTSSAVLAGGEHQHQQQQTIPDPNVSAPTSLLFYDDVDSGGVVCARGVCVLEDYDYDYDYDDTSNTNNPLLDSFLNSYLGPRLLLAVASILYGTNFALGAIMNDALPPSAATSARMVLAAVALAPFLGRLAPRLQWPALLCGCCTALGYIAQSVALVTVPPATVAFLGAATVVVCPTLEAVVNKTPMRFKDAPQIWLAAVLCLTGVGVLELLDHPSSNAILAHTPTVGVGDVLALLQAVGFGTSFFLTERMMRGQPDQALPITAVQVSVTAFLSMLWCIADGWIGDTTQLQSASYGLPQLFLDPNMQLAAAAVAWTGLVTTALNRFVETTALGKLKSAEASVILATEPLWAALFAVLWLSDDTHFGINDYVGGALIVVACLVNTLQPKDFDFVLGSSSSADEDAKQL